MTPYDEHLQNLLYDHCKDDDYDAKNFRLIENIPLVHHENTVEEVIAAAREEQKKERLRGGNRSKDIS